MESVKFEHRVYKTQPIQDKIQDKKHKKDRTKHKKSSCSLHAGEEQDDFAVQVIRCARNSALHRLILPLCSTDMYRPDRHGG